MVVVQRKAEVVLSDVAGVMHPEPLRVVALQAVLWADGELDSQSWNIRINAV